MSLTLSSSDTTFDAALRQIDSDGSTSPIELQTIRDQADQHLAKATGSDTLNPETALGSALTRFLALADDIVECMQRVSLDARKEKLAQDRRNALKAAIEHQIAYVVAGYKSSVERL